MSTGRYLHAELETELVPSPSQYSVLLPPGYDALAEPLPLCLHLHGGGRDRDDLEFMQPWIEACWDQRLIPPMLFAAVSSGRSFYMDYRDGSQRWETFLLGG